MSDKPNSGNSDELEKDDEFIKPISEEEGLKSAESFFKSETNRDNNDISLEEDKEFVKYLKFRKKAKDLGLEEFSTTTINYQGGVHIKDSNVKNHGNIAGNDQTVHSNINSGGFSGGFHEKSFNDNESTESIEAIFDRCEDIEQRSFIIALAVLNGCKYNVAPIQG